MISGIAEEGRKLHDRGPGARGLVVDVEGAALGPACPLVEPMADGYRAIGPVSAAQLLRTVFDYDGDARPFEALCQSITKALDAGNQPRAANGEWGDAGTPASTSAHGRGVVIHGDGQAAYDGSVEYLSRSPLAAKVLDQAAALGVVVNIVSGNPDDGARDQSVLENGEIR